MMEDFWLVNIFEIIRDISDLEYQKDSWLGKSSKVSSFDEIISSLYDDNAFEEFINNTFWKNCKKELNPLFLKLSELNHMINKYENPDSAKEILRDVRWLEITRKADEIIKVWIKSIRY